MVNIPISGVKFAANMLGFLLYAAEQGENITVIDFGAADAHACKSFHAIGQAFDVAHSNTFFTLMDASIRNGNRFGFDEVFHDTPPAGTSNWNEGRESDPIGGHGTHDHGGFIKITNWNSVEVITTPPLPVDDFDERVKGIEDLHGVDEVLVEDFVSKLHKHYGFTEQGAAWFTGALVWESGLDPNIEGDGGAALGLAQWHSFRRNSNFPYGDVWGQLEYAVNEMKNNYPTAYAIYTDPNASDEDLSRANYIYEGYGVKGLRDTFGDLLEQQINAQDGID